jgi:hypothetical protein
VTLDDGSDDNTLLIDLRGPAQFSVGFEVQLVNAFRKGKEFDPRSSGNFRYGCTVLELSSIPAGTYSIRCMTFEAGKEGPFLLKCECSTGIKLNRVQ